MLLGKTLAALAALAACGVQAGPCKVSSSTSLSSTESTTSTTTTPTSTPESTTASSTPSSTPESTTASSTPESTPSTTPSMTPSSSTTTTTTTTQAAATCDVNIVQNPGFAGANGDSTSFVFSPWTNAGVSGFGTLLSSSMSHTTPWALKFNIGDGAGSATVSQTLNPISDHVYYWSFWYYVQSHSTTSTLTCSISNAEATTITVNLATTLQSTWLNTEGYAGVGEVPPVLTCTVTSDGAAVVYVDDFSFALMCQLID